MPKGVYLRKPLRDCFWSKVDKKGPDDCWEWTAAKNRFGYGQIRISGKTVLAHRASWELANGSIPKGRGYHGTCVLHHCDNKTCVNPKHLFLGTQADNIHDMERKGRQRHPRGEVHGRSKLSEQNVHEIRSLLKAGQIQREIASVYDVDETTICNISTGYSWGWLKEA